MTPLEFIYYLGYSAKKHYSLKCQKRLPHKVISIGNITAGGTGKTPATIADLVRQSHEARKRSKELLEKAKKKVEQLIEKK